MREHLRAATFGRSLIDFRLCDFASDFGAGRHTHPKALADRSGQHPKKSDGPRRTRPDRLRPCLDPDRPGRPQKPPDGSTGGRICKPHRHGNGPQRATGDAIHGNGWDANATRKRMKAAWRKKNKAGLNYTRKKKMQHRAATEATRKEGRMAAAWQQNAPAGEDPRQGEKNPAGSVAPGGSELLEQGLEHGPEEDNCIDDQHGASPPYAHAGRDVNGLTADNIAGDNRNPGCRRRCCVPLQLCGARGVTLAERLQPV